MANSVRVVSFTNGGQVSEVAVLESALGFDVSGSAFLRDTLGILRGDRNQQMIRRGGRYDGESFAGERVSNSTYKFTVLLGGGTMDALLAKIDNFLSVTERVPGTLYIEHKPDGATYPSYLEIRAPAKVQQNESWVEQVGSGAMRVDVEWPVAPLVCGAPLDVTDAAVATNLADYTFDALNVAGFPTSAGALTTERRIVHTIRGYTYGSQHVTVSGAPGPTLTGYKLGAVVKRVAADSYIEVYVDDDGTNSRLRIDTINAGLRTNRFTTNLGARIFNGATFYVRGRIEGSVVTAEYLLGDFALTYGGVTTGSYTLTGGDATLLGSDVPGVGGFSWIPQHANATVPTFRVLPYTYASKTLPDAWALDGTIPGSAPAKVTTFVHGNNPGYVRPFCMIATTPKGAGSLPDMFGIFEAEAGYPSAGVATSDASARGGYVVQGSPAAQCYWSVDLTNIHADAETPGRQMAEVWLRVKVPSTATGVTVSVYMSVPGGIIGSLEAAVAITPPSAGTAYKFLRVGTISVEKLSASDTGLLYATVTRAGGTGNVGIDYAEVHPASRRSSSPTNKATSGYPKFLDSAEVRTIETDLQGWARSNSVNAMADKGARAPGLSGAPIEFPPGKVGVFAKLSSGYSNPALATDTENATEMAGIHFGVVPRYFYLRDR